MHRKAFVAVGSWLVVAVIFSAPVQGNQRHTIRWDDRIDRAWAASKDAGQPLLLFVTYDGCSFCEKMSQSTFTHPGVVSRIRQSFVPLKVQGQHAPELLEKLDIKSFPTTLIISPQAHVLEKISGFVSPTKLIDLLDSATSTRTAATPGGGQSR